MIALLLQTLKTV